MSGTEFCFVLVGLFLFVICLVLVSLYLCMQGVFLTSFHENCQNKNVGFGPLSDLGVIILLPICLISYKYITL